MLITLATALGLAAALCFQGGPSQSPVPPQAPVERLGDNLFRIGNIRVDTATREISVRGYVNMNVTALEFLANARGGLKAYESAMTLETDAINFNVALVLIGLDRRNARPSSTHFDPSPVGGDPVAITIEGADGKFPRGPIERVLYDKARGVALPESNWVYTGSTFYPDGRYAADADGVLIGFAHTPSSIVESVEGIGLGRYGTIVLNPKIAEGTMIVLRVTALKPPAGAGTAPRTSRK